MPIGPGDVNGIVSAINPRQLTKRGEPVIRNTLVAFGQEALENLITDATFSARDPRVVEFLATWGAERVTGMINETTQTHIQAALIRGLESGQTTAEMADAIDRVFTARSSSLTIVRTEITRASSFGTETGIRQAGAPRKQWLSTQDGAVRDTHVDLDGQIQNIDEPFVSSSGAVGMYPGDFGDPAEDINCRCGVLPVLDERQLRQFAAARRRSVVWKVLERKRAPWDRRLKAAFRLGFDAQREDTIDALYAAAGETRAA